MDNQFNFRGKVYNSKSSYRGAKTRFYNKSIKELQQLPISNARNNLIIEHNQIINQFKTEQKNEQKIKRQNQYQLKKILKEMNIITEPTQKTQPERNKNRIKNVISDFLKSKNVTENIQYRDRNKYERLALNGRIKELKIEGHNNLASIIQRKTLIETISKNEINYSQTQRLKLSIQLTLKYTVKQQVIIDGQQTMITLYHFTNSQIKSIVSNSDITFLTNNLENTFNKDLEQAHEGSNSRFDKFISLKFRILRQSNKSFVGNHVELSDEIKNSKSVINIKNMDNKCLEYCLVCYRYKTQIKNKNTTSPKIYEKYFKYIKIPENQHYPIDIEQDIPKYELLNNINIVVYEIKHKKFYVKFKSDFKNKDKEKECMNLLLIEDDNENKHFCLINNISRLTNVLAKDKKHKSYYCENCNIFVSSTIEALEKHQSLCNNNEQTHITLPTKGVNDIMKFRNYQNEFKHPFSLFCDFESTLMKVDKKDDDDEPTLNNNTKYYQKHVPNSFGLKYNCIHNEYSDEYKCFINKDDKKLTSDFIKECEKYAQKSYKLTQKNKFKTKWKNTDEIQKHNRTKKCDKCNCGFEITNKKVAHHDHINGEFIGTYCNNCNLKYQYQRFLPIYIHNLKGYDSHLFIEALYDNSTEDEKFHCIPNTEEKYLSFSKTIKVDEYYNKKTETMKPILYEIKFIDSYAILSGSLDSLTENLKKNCNNTEELRNTFTNTSDAFVNDEDFILMTSKGVYPYDYIDNFEKLNEPHLPKRKMFYSRLNNQHIKLKEYARAQHIFKHFNCKSIMDYHKLYLKADVLLLNDVWNNFKDVCFNNYKLDPSYYISAPSLSWDSFLKLSEIELELITDYEMYLFIEKGIRGGLSQISKRYSQANNKYMKNYDKTKPDKYISYFDANNLYGWAMSEYLPYKDFKWNTDEWDVNKIQKLDDKADTGYLFNVDLHIPKDKHDYFNNYCPLPLNKSILKSDLNDNQLEDYIESPIKKLCCSLEDRTEFTINYRMLKMVLKLGFQLVKVNKVVEYKQKPFMKEYIDKNTQLRTKAKTDFEKDFFKLMNNSAYGKTMENVRNRIDFELVNTEEKLDNIKRVKKVTIFRDNLIGVHKAKYSCKLNKPIYIGQNVLDDSKLLMNNFHYGFMMEKVGIKNMDLLFTDTDSVCYEIRDVDIYKVMKENKDEFDLSNFTNEMNDNTNKKVIGKMKDESPDSVITEFIGLRAKVYSYTTDNDYNCKKNKGIKRTIMNKLIHHQDYKDCLLNDKTKYIIQNSIQSKKHTLYSISQRKKALDKNDDKVFILEDGINTRTHGHYKNKLEQQQQY